jgi:hypothetical protein
MQSQRWAWTHRYAVPMFVASLVAVVLSGAALTVVLMLDRASGSGGERGFGDNAQTNPGGGPGSGQPGDTEGQGDGAGNDSGGCLVGSWRVVSQTQGVSSGLGALLGGGRVDLAGEGPVFEFRADGSGRGDYGDPTTFETTSGGETVAMEVRGHVDFRYEATGDTLAFRDMTSHAEVTYPIFGTIPYQLSEDPVSYTCDEGTAVFTDPAKQYEAVYERL